MTTDLLTFTNDTITIFPWSESTSAEQFDLRDDYIEFFWLPSLGPSAVLMLRRIGAFLENEPDGFDVHLPSFSNQLGLGAGTARTSPFRRAFERLVYYDLASPTSTDELYVHTTVPSITRRQLMRLPASLRKLHATWNIPTEERVSVSEMKSRAFHTAATMRSGGHTKEEVTAQLMQWHFHPAIVHDAVERAFTRITETVA